MIYDCFVMLVTQHNIAIRSMDKALQHFKIDWSSCIRLTRSFESSLRGRRSKGKGGELGRPNPLPLPLPLLTPATLAISTATYRTNSTRRSALYASSTKTRQSELVNNFGK